MNLIKPSFPLYLSDSGSVQALQSGGIKVAISVQVVYEANKLHVGGRMENK